MSLVFYPDHVRISIPLAKALLAFASTDSTRPHLGVAMHHATLAATNGHALLIVENSGDCRFDGARPENYHGRVWPHAHVEQALRVARARKEADVELRYAEARSDLQFPPVEQVVPDYGVELSGPVGIDPHYLAAIGLVTKALGVKGACLAAARAPLDPLGFTVGNAEGLEARVVVMPMRLDAPESRLRMRRAEPRKRARKSA